MKIGTLQLLQALPGLLTPVAASPTPLPEISIPTGAHKYTIDKLSKFLSDTYPSTKILGSPSETVATRLRGMIPWFNSTLKTSTMRAKIQELLTAHDALYKANPTFDIQELIKTTIINNELDISLTGTLIGANANAMATYFITNVIDPAIAAVKAAPAITFIDNIKTEIEAKFLTESSEYLISNPMKYQLFQSLESQILSEVIETINHHAVYTNPNLPYKDLAGIKTKYTNVINTLTATKFKDAQFIGKETEIMLVNLQTDLGKIPLLQQAHDNLFFAELRGEFEKATPSNIKTLMSKIIDLSAMDAKIKKYFDKQHITMEPTITMGNDVDNVKTTATISIRFKVNTVGITVSSDPVNAEQHQNKALKIQGALTTLFEKWVANGITEEQKKELNGNFDLPYPSKLISGLQKILDDNGLVIGDLLFGETEKFLKYSQHVNGEDWIKGIILGRVFDKAEFDKGGISKIYAGTETLFAHEFKVHIKFYKDSKIVKKSLHDDQVGRTIFTSDAQDAVFKTGHILTPLEILEINKNYPKTGDKIKEILERFALDGKKYLLKAFINRNDKKNIVIRYTFSDTLDGTIVPVTFTTTIKITMSQKEQEKHDEMMVLKSIVEKLESMKITSANPVTPTNIQTFANQNPNEGDLNKFVDGFAAIKLLAQAKHVTIVFEPFVASSQGLVTSFTVESTKIPLLVDHATNVHLSPSFVDPHKLAEDKKALHKLTEATKIIVGKDEKLSPQEKAETIAKIDKIAKDFDDKVSKPGLTEEQLEAAKQIAEKELSKIQIPSMDNIKGSKLEKFLKDHPDLTAEQIAKIQEAMKNTDIAKNKDEAEKMIDMIGKIDFNQLLSATKIMSLSQKITLLVLGVFAGIGALLSSMNVFKLLTVNKRLSKIPNQQIKMRASKKMAIISGVASIGFTAITVGMMILVFVIKGGL